MRKPEGKAPAGWFDSPEHEGYEQYWNGSFWTKQTRPVGSAIDFKQKGNFALAVSNGFSKIFDYKGTAKRFEFWYFLLFSYISIFVVGMFAGISTSFQAISGLYAICLIPCLLSCEVRRMHDAGKSGWFILVPIYNLYLLVQPSVVSD